MKLADVSAADIAAALGSTGLDLRTGPVVTRLQSSIKDLSVSVQRLYADFTYQTRSEFVDFEVRVETRRGIWPPLSKQVVATKDAKPLFLASPRRTMMAIVEWGLNACIYRDLRHLVIVHAAVLERNGRALILAAPSGSGKSTLCAGLAFRNWRLLSDELTLIRPDDGAILPLCRPICLKDHSVRLLQRFEPAAVFGPQCPGTHKGTVVHVRPPKQAVDCIDQTAKPGHVVFPRYQPGANAELSSVSKGTAFRRLNEQCFNGTVLGAIGFRSLIEIIDNSECFDFTYGDLEEAVACLDLLEPVASHQHSEATLTPTHHF